VVQRERPDRQARFRVRVPDPAPALHVADALNAQERLQLLDLELDASVHQRPEHLDLLLLVHPFLDHVEGHGLVPLPPPDKGLEELECRRRVQIRDERRHAAEGKPVRRVLLLPLRGPRVDRLQDGLIVCRLVDVRRVRIRCLRTHRLRIRVNVLDQPELLVLLVSGKGEGHLLPDFGRPFVREDPQHRHPFLEALGHEQAHEHLLPDVRGAVDGRVGPERDASEQQVVEPGDPHLDLLLLHLDLEVFVPGLDVLRNETLLPQPEFFHLLLEVPLLRADLLFLRGDRALQFLEARLEVQLLDRAALRLRLLHFAVLRLEDFLAIHEVFLAPYQFFLLVGERFLHFLDVVLLDLQVRLQTLQLLFPHQDHLLLVQDLLLFPRKRCLHFRFRLAFEGLRLRPYFVLDLVFADFLLEPDDPFLELLFLREVVFRHLAELLLEPAFQLFAGSSALAGRHGCEAILFRLERRLALHEVQLPLLHLALVRLHLPEAGLELFAQLLVHGPLLAHVGLEGLTGLRLLIEALLELRRAARLELLRLDVLDDGDRAFLDVFDVLLQFPSLRDLRLQLFREVRGLLDVLDRIELSLPEVHKFAVQRGAHRFEFGVEAVDLKGLRPQLAHLVIRHPLGRSPGSLCAARGGWDADPILERRIFAGQPLPERVILRIAPRDGGTDPRIQSTVRIALEPGGGAFVVRLRRIGLFRAADHALAVRIDFASAHAADLRDGALRGLHRHRACASLSIDSTTDPEEPVGTRYATRGYLIVATSISSNNLAGLQGRNGLRKCAGGNRIYEGVGRHDTSASPRSVRFWPRFRSDTHMPSRDDAGPACASALRQRLTRASQGNQNPRRRQRCPTQPCRGRVALDLVVQAGLGQEGYRDHQCALRCWP